MTTDSIKIFVSRIKKEKVLVSGNNYEGYLGNEPDNSELYDVTTI